jgi:hypothetical protein
MENRRSNLKTASALRASHCIVVIGSLLLVSQPNRDVDAGSTALTTASPAFNLSSGAPWGPNVRVNDDTGTAGQETPDIAMDPEGNAFAVWVDGRNVNGDIYFSYRPAGGSWGANVRVNDDPGTGYQLEPSIAVDPSGNAYAVWRDERSGCDIYFSYRPAGGSWGVNEKVNDLAGGSFNFDPAIAADDNGNAYAVWMSGSYFGTHDVYFSYRPTDGSWAASVRVNDGDPGTAWEGVDIAVDADGNAYAVWGDQRDPGTGVYFSYKAAGGGWGTNVKVNDPPGTGYQGVPALAVDGSGNAYAVWLDGHSAYDDIYFSYRPVGGPWGTNVRLDDDPGTASQAWPSIAVSASGNAYAVWQDSRNDFGDIYCSRRPAGGAWAPNVRVDDDATGATQNRPSVAVDPSGGVCAVWVDYRSANADIDFSSNRWPYELYVPLTLKRHQ